jgi:ABC-type oligopeptide transport system substrate-binding subunit
MKKIRQGFMSGVYVFLVLVSLMLASCASSSSTPSKVQPIPTGPMSTPGVFHQWSGSEQRAMIISNKSL